MLKRTRQASLGQESTMSSSRQNTMTSPQEPRSLASQQTPRGGATLLGLLAAKRFTRNLRNKYGRSSSIYGSSRHSTSVHIPREPTYRMEPSKKFNPDEVRDAIRVVVDERMKGFTYHPKICSNMCKLLTEEIKDSTKRFRYDRYKIVVLVHIGEKGDQCAFVASRCVWDQNLDDFATYSYESASLFCTASVYGIYNE